MTTTNTLTPTAQQRLKSFIDRLERLDQNRDELTADVREVFQESKNEGFDVKIMRKIIRLRKIDRAKREEEQAIVDLYMHSLGEE